MSAQPDGARHRVLPHLARVGDLRAGRADPAAGVAQRRSTHPRAAHRPVRPGVSAGARSAGGLPVRTGTGVGLQQPARSGRRLGQRVLEGPRTPPSRHRQPAPTGPGLRRVEAAVANPVQDRHHRGRGEDNPVRGTPRLPPMPDSGPGVLPGPGPVGLRGPRPLGAVGRALPDRRRRDQPAQAGPPAQVPHGRPHPPTASRAAGPGAQRRGATQDHRCAPAGGPRNPARGMLRRRRADLHPLAHHRARRQGLDRRPGQAGNGGTWRWRKTARSGRGPASRC